jgi:NAD(P)-dependent dehydrogenase (short-subunit alcohol dehydrogenase family)
MGRIAVVAGAGAGVGRATATVFARKPLRRCLDKDPNRRLWNPRQFDVRALKSSPTLGNRSDHCATFSRAGSVEGIVPTAIDNNH